MTIRVAAAQFAVTNDVEQNLATCIRMIRQAGEHNPDLIQLPEFCNHNSWYDDQAHCIDVAVPVGGDFLNAIADTAKEVNAFVMINCTVRRDNDVITGTNLLFNKQGELVGQTDKQVLIGHENDYLTPSTEVSEIFDTELGKIGLYCCMDGVINEPPRLLGLYGGQILCNALNSFAIDEGTLHIPVRAAENKVWVVAANKVGPLIPEALLEPVSEATQIPVKFLSGAGDSQIVAPDGRVLAIAGKDEEVIWADIDVSEANNKTRPDGTDVFANRRTDLYSVLAQDPATQDLPQASLVESVSAATIAIKGGEQAAIADAVEQIQSLQNQGVKLIALPELFWLTKNADTQAGHELSQTAVDAIASVLQAETYVSTSIVAEQNGAASHCGVLISNQGVVLQQGQIHASNRFGWSAQADRVETLDTVYGKLAVLLEDDAIYPELGRLYAFAGADVILAPLNTQESWQSQTGLRERAAENRINIVAASGEVENCIICFMQHDFTLMTPWKNRKFDGLLSEGEFVRATDTQLIANVHPSASANKVASHRTHLINNRPWRQMATVVDSE
ncbi:nitrilase-related carbon-nitrogen hydrolase [Paraferrimonas sedimenticola]|uniref:Amidohydrolase n=1 Tax=Paraferrimonas sedimenticola TaxID=375674 RepID=A0AA37RW27_9GAMM|nr:nitrilase-related carbon-nitrogen hydrolase [Paraferrimonas sedimenticola]GLP96379.1 amidohydrolase [Paraferrimonas sedimenticola]